MQSVGNYTHETVPTEFVEADGIRYAYRRFGRHGKVPLLLLTYLGSKLIESLEVIQKTSAIILAALEHEQEPAFADAS
jgi:hypothetical protein